MPRDPNDGQDYEDALFPRARIERDVDRDIDDAQEAAVALDRQIQGQRKVEQLFAAIDPTKFGETWKKVNGL